MEWEGGLARGGYACENGSKRATRCPEVNGSVKINGYDRFLKTKKESVLPVVDAIITRSPSGYGIMILVGGAGALVHSGIRTKREALRLRTKSRKAMKAWDVNRKLAIANEIADLVRWILTNG